MKEIKKRQDANEILPLLWLGSVDAGKEKEKETERGQFFFLFLLLPFFPTPQPPLFLFFLRTK